MSARSALLAALVVLSASGCVFINQTASLSPQAPAGLPALQRGYREVVLVGVNDARRQRDRVGVRKNGYGAETADVVSSIDPLIWLEESVAETLRRTGYSLVDNPSDESIALELNVTHLFSEVEPGFWSADWVANVRFSLEAELPDGSRHRHRIAGIAVWTGNSSVGSNPHEEVLQQAMDQAMERTATAMLELSQRGAS